MRTPPIAANPGGLLPGEPGQYFDDEDAGLSFQTSHPCFVALAPRSFYDVANDFAPFCNDAGHDTLRGLEQCFSDHGSSASAFEYLTSLLTEWALEIPAADWGLPEQELGSWLRQTDMHEVFVSAEARARLAAALGELKITGAVSKAMLAEAMKALRLLNFIAADTSRHPDRTYRGEAIAALSDSKKVFGSAPKR